MRTLALSTIALTGCGLFEFVPIPCNADENCPTGRFCDLESATCTGGDRTGDVCADGQHGDGDGVCVDDGDCRADFELYASTGCCGRWRTVADLRGVDTSIEDVGVATLRDGCVLIAGGETTNADDIDLAFLVDVDAGEVTRLRLNTSRTDPTLTTLNDGRVLRSGN